MAAPLTTSQMNDLLAPGLAYICHKEFDGMDRLYDKVARVMPSNRKTETVTQVTTFGAMVVRSESGETTPEVPVQGADQSVTNAYYAKQYRVSKMMVRTDQYKITGPEMAQNLGESAVDLKETLVFNILNNAFTTTFGDGKVLCATDHSLYGSGGTQANRPTTHADLSVTSLKAALTAFRKLKTPKNLVMKVIPKVLIVAPDDEFTAEQIVKSNLLSGTQLNDVTPSRIKGLGILSSPHLTDTDAWFVMTEVRKSKLFLFELEKFYTWHDTDTDTEDLKFNGALACSVTVGDYPWIYGTSGAS